MEEVSKERFKEAYFRHAQPNSGWTPEYWTEFFEKDRVPPMRYRVEPPATPEHHRMMVVTDFKAGEHRLFFMTEEAEESFFDR